MRITRKGPDERAVEKFRQRLVRSGKELAAKGAEEGDPKSAEDERLSDELLNKRPDNNRSTL